MCKDALRNFLLCGSQWKQDLDKILEIKRKNKTTKRREDKMCIKAKCVGACLLLLTHLLDNKWKCFIKSALGGLVGCVFAATTVTSASQASTRTRRVSQRGEHQSDVVMHFSCPRLPAGQTHRETPNCVDWKRDRTDRTWTLVTTTSASRLK